MFNSVVLDLVVGLIFTFLALSLAVSAMVEAIASVLKWRSQTLLQSVKDLLNDPQFNGLALDMYNHGLVNPRDDGNAKSEQGLKHPPAYIDAQHFAEALIELTQIAKTSPGAMRSAIDSGVRNPQINTLLKGIVDRTNGDLARMRNELAVWFDSAMDRVSGVYKRRTQLWSFAIALIMAAALNVSAIDIGRALWQQPMAVRTLAPQPNQTLRQALAELKDFGNTGVPIGWTTANFEAFVSTRGIWTFLGWLITAVATLIGAPFWFDTLQQIVRLKGSGPSPAEKRLNTGAAA